MFRTRRSSAGYTLIELVVAMSVALILLVFFSIAFVNAYHDTFTSKAVSQADVGLQNAMDIIEKDVRYSIGFKPRNDAPFYDSYGTGTSSLPSNYYWNYTGSGSDSRVLVLANYATNQRSESSTRQNIFTNTSQYDCATQMSYQPKLQYRVVYFVKDKVLYRRILTDTATALCPGQQAQAQKRSCPSEVFSGAHTGCFARDEAIARNVSKFSVDYFNDGEAMETQYQTDGEEDITAADSVRITLSLTMEPSKITRSNTLNITRVN